jgi:thiol:disulfide interchange protein/DsbC/DsbD-like thiol-disulfide interchange protein
MIRAFAASVLLALSALATLVPGITPAHAAESAAVSSKRLTATIVTDTDHPQAGATIGLGLRLRLAPGWHTYWRYAGDAGAPAIFTVAHGATDGAVTWPSPTVLKEGPLVTFGYDHDVLLTKRVTLPASGPRVLTAHAEWLVCRDICVPERGDFTVDLGPAPAPGGPSGTLSAEAPLFTAAAAETPRPSPFTATVGPKGTLRVETPGLDRRSVRSAMFIPAGPGIAVGEPPTMTVEPGRLIGHLKAGVKDVAGILRITDQAGAVSDFDLSAKPGAAVPVADAPAPHAVPSLSLGRIILLALGGGLLLNLMPCVFPVLAMKAVSIAQGAQRGAVRAHAIFYSAGVMVTFTALGALLLALRAAGGDAALSGWGFQFQSPVFVAATTWLLFAIGLNLSGVFEFGGGFVGAGQSLTARKGHVGSFFTGLLAVLVATPCTAPFMGVAIAAAIAAPPAVGLLVFVAMGAGLAAPTLLLAIVPGLARAAPKPGAWMVILKQALAFPMYAAAAWMLWVLSVEAGPSGVLAGAAGLVLIGLAAWVWGLAAGTLEDHGRRLAQTIAVAACLAAAAVLAGMPTTTGPSGAGTAETAALAGAEPFSDARLAALRAEGRPVFVDMTAAWCVTCLVNERVALDPTAVRDAFAAHKVAYLRGDWTRQDPAITRFLRGRGREGVPFYAIYAPGAEMPEILPQILTPRVVLDALDRATRPHVAFDKAR